MLEFYFEDPITIERLRAGPSGQFMDSFSGGLKKAGYTSDLHFRDCKKCNVFEMLEENVVATSVTSNNR